MSDEMPVELVPDGRWEIVEPVVTAVGVLEWAAKARTVTGGWHDHWNP